MTHEETSTKIAIVTTPGKSWCWLRIPKLSSPPPIEADAPPPPDLNAGWGGVARPRTPPKHWLWLEQKGSMSNGSPEVPFVVHQLHPITPCKEKQCSQKYWILRTCLICLMKKLLKVLRVELMCGMYFFATACVSTLTTLIRGIYQSIRVWICPKYSKTSI